MSKPNTDQSFIEPADLRGRLEQDDKLVVIDVRSTEEFEAWHVDGAINIHAAELAARVTEIPQDAAVITVCNLSGARSCGAAEALQHLGFSDALVLRGGIHGWKETEKPANSPASIYLDYNASTPIDPVVAAIMRPLLESAFGKPSSGHWASLPAKASLERARGQIAALLGCTPDEIVFTGSGSESNNLALKGTFLSLRDRGEHIITQATEHPAILKPLQFLEQLGAKVTYLPVDGTGRVDPDAVRQAITARTILVSIMHANNETGTVQPIEAIAAIAREHSIRFHTDAAQSVGKIATRVDALGVDLLSIAGHKLYAPKGVGALYVRQGITLEPLIHGAGHEQGRRAGTESVLMAAALGEACALATDLEPMVRVRALRDHFWQGLQAIYGEQIVLNGHPEHRLSNTLNVSFVGQVGAQVLGGLDGVAASTGSACHAGRIELSPVLAAMGVTEHTGMGAVRFSLGRGTTRVEIDTVLSQFQASRSSTGRTDMQRNSND